MKTFQRFLLVVVALVAALSGVVWYMLADWLHPALMARLQRSTREEVREMLGPPTSYQGGPPNAGPEEASEWEYIRPGRLAILDIDFSEDGRVERVGYDR